MTVGFSRVIGVNRVGIRVGFSFSYQETQTLLASCWLCDSVPRWWW